jgi:broad specificity phosphatase PhoE
LRDRPIQRLYVSRLQRAQETAAIVNTRHCAQLHVDARLDDRRSGFEGLPVETYLQAMQAAPAPFDWAAPGGESYRQLVARSQAFLADLRGSGLETVLVVTHHEVLQALIGHCRGLDLASRWRLPVEYAQMFEFELD